MLKSLRKKGVAKKVIWVVAIVLIISFGFLGTAYLLTDSGSVRYAGKLYGKKVSLEDFNKIYQAVRIQVIRQYGNNLDKVSQLLNLDDRTWDRMILLHEAQKKRIRVSNEEVVQSIEEDTSFMKNNRFDSLLYNAILRNLQVRPRDYEESMRDNLKITKLFHQATSSVTISEDDVFNAYREKNAKVQVSYIFVANESFKDGATADEPKVKKYYEEHSSEFLTPSSINVQYIDFLFPEPLEPTEDTPITAEQEAELDYKKNTIRDKAEKIFQELLINPQMEEVARKSGMTAKTSGFFSKEQPNLALGWSYDLLNRIFQMGLEEVNKPFETSNGMVIAQVKEIKEPYVPDYDEAKDKARESVIDIEAKEVAKKKAGEYKEAILAELDKSKLRDFPKAAKELGLDIIQTPVFNRGQYLPQVGLSKEFQEAAFALSESNNISDVIETQKGYCILHLDSQVPVENSDYEKAKEELAQSISNEKRGEVFNDYLMQLRQEAKLIDNIPQLRTQTQ